MNGEAISLPDYFVNLHQEDWGLEVECHVFLQLGHVFPRFSEDLTFSSRFPHVFHTFR